MTRDTSLNELEKAIQADRMRAAASLQALSARLSPEGLVAHAKDQARDVGDALGGVTADAARRYPAAASLLGVAAAWLGTRGMKAASVKEDKAPPQVAAHTDATSLPVSEPPGRAFYERQPLVAGAAALTLGVVLGAIVWQADNRKTVPSQDDPTL